MANKKSFTYDPRLSLILNFKKKEKTKEDSLLINLNFSQKIREENKLDNNSFLKEQNGINDDLKNSFLIRTNRKYYWRFLNSKSLQNDSNTIFLRDYSSKINCIDQIIQHINYKPIKLYNRRKYNYWSQKEKSNQSWSEATVKLKYNTRPKYSGKISNISIYKTRFPSCREFFKNQSDNFIYKNSDYDRIRKIYPIKKFSIKNIIFNKQDLKDKRAMKKTEKLKKQIDSKFLDIKKLFLLKHNIVKERNENGGNLERLIQLKQSISRLRIKNSKSSSSFYKPKNFLKNNDEISPWVNYEEQSSIIVD